MSNYPDGVTDADIDRHFGHSDTFDEWCSEVADEFAVLPNLFGIKDCNPEQYPEAFDAGTTPETFAQTRWEYYRDEY